jgi:F0F1-type ATP synthase epsilon subunit
MSVLVSGSFLNMHKETATVMTQTEGFERLKQFSIAETQTELKETANTKCQTDRADAVNTCS